MPHTPSTILLRRVHLLVCVLMLPVFFACSGGDNSSPPAQSGGGSGGGGTPQPTGQPGRFDGPVAALIAVPNGNGDMYVAGAFTTYNNQPVRPVVRLRPDGTLNDSFKLTDAVTAPAPGKRIVAIVAADDGTGDLYVGEDSSAPVNTPDDKGQVWKVTPAGGLAPGFTPGTVVNFGFGFPGPISVSTDLFDIAPVGDGSGRVYVAGVFDRYNDVPVSNLVRLNTNGTIDPAFVAVPSSNALPRVSKILPAKDGTGDLYIMTYGQVGPSSFAPERVERRNADGTPDPSFASFRPVDGAPRTFTLVDDGSGDLFVTGGFLRVPEDTGTPRPGFVRLNPDGSLDEMSPRLNPDTSPDATSPWPELMFPKFLTKATDGTNDWFAARRVIDPATGAETSTLLQRFKADGTRDQNFTTGQVSSTVGRDQCVSAHGFALCSGINIVLSAPDATGDAYVAGGFTTYNSATVGHIVRINANGTLD